MSLFPVKLKQHTINGSISTKEETEYLLVGRNKINERQIPLDIEDRLADLICNLFVSEHHHSHHHPRTTPKLPPEIRGKRHRNYYIYSLNQFRHWWKKSRLLVRLAGGIVFCEDVYYWERMAEFDVTHNHQAIHALRYVKKIGRGGPIKVWLKQVHPFTRTVRIILAVARAWEARVDNRLYEVGVAEAFAFMGNRCSRFWARHLADWVTRTVSLPLSGALLAPYLDQNSRPVSIAVGFIRAVLPFAASFQGSRLGRQLTFNTYKFANYRWKPVQSIMKFHEKAGVYQDTNLDPKLLELARSVAESIGHGKDPHVVRANLAAIGFNVFGSGTGGYAVYRKIDGDKTIHLHVTPYGPSILGELPCFIILERRTNFYIHHVVDKPVAVFLDAATPREAKVRGYTYSGAFFQSQEWAALKQRYDKELLNYSNACSIMGTDVLPYRKRNSHYTKVPAPPVDLQSLKAFLRTGRPLKKQRKDKRNWKTIQHEVNKMANLVARLQQQRKAPSRVILYLEGLDCSGKSSTGMLICNALQQCGYTVNVAQHNRPPTPEQQEKPWMDRGRFEYPDDMFASGDEVPEYASLVWDRGPCGDFVYGPLGQLPIQKKLNLYEEFRKYDYNCRREDVLFCKVFFVCDRDSIAKTLGKRLAHKQIARDLRAWLDANSVEHSREGLEEIELHIDPTDFVAFNRYEKNLSKFAEVVRNTDYIGLVEKDTASGGYNNPWLVVNTSDRFRARMSILKAFERQLNQFVCQPYDRLDAIDRLGSFFDSEIDVQPVTEAVPSDIVHQKEHGLSWRAVFQSLLLGCLLGAYLHQTWKVDLEDIT